VLVAGLIFCVIVTLLASVAGPENGAGPVRSRAVSRAS